MPIGERLFFVILEEIGKELVSPQPQAGVGIPGGKIAKAVADNFSNPLFLFLARSLGCYDQENSESLREAVKVASEFAEKVHRLPRLLLKRTTPVKTIEDISDEEFANVVVETKVPEAPDHLFSSHGARKPLEAKDKTERVKGAACAASRFARLFRKVDVGLFLDNVSKHAIPPGDLVSEDGLTDAHGTYQFLCSLVKLLGEALIPPERLGEILASYKELMPQETLEKVFDPNKLLDEAWKHTILTFKSQLENANKAEIQRLKSLEERRRLREEEAARRKEQEKQELEAAALKAAQAAAEAMQRGLTEWHLKFQSVPLDAESTRALEQVGKTGWVRSNLRDDAGRVGEIFRKLHEEILDYRAGQPEEKGNPSLQKLGQLIFAPLTMALVAMGHGVDAQRQLNVTIPKKTPDVRGAHALSELLSSSTAARAAVEVLLADPEAIAVVAVLVLPLQDATSYVAGLKKARGPHEEEEARAKLEPKVRDALELLRKKGVVRRALGIRETGEQATELPEWLDKNKPEFLADFAVWTEGDLVVFALRDFETHAFQLSAKRVSEQAKCLAECERQAQICRDRRDLESLLDELTGECGFVLDDPTDAQPTCVIRHEAYGIEATLPAEREHWGKRLREVHQNFLSCETSWQRLLDAARVEGWSVTQGDSGTSMRRGVESVSLALGRYIPMDRLDEVARLIDNRSEPALAALQSEARDRRRQQAIRRERRFLTEVLPQRGEEVLIPDTSFYLRVVAPRGNTGARWLDLAIELSKLPEIRYAVPLSVYFELLGEIFPFDAKEPITIEHRRGDEVRALREVFRSACRIRVGDGDPQVKNIDTSNSRILLVETPEDRKLITDILAIREATEGNPRAFEARLRDEIYGKSRGEMAIRSFIESTSFPNHITVITDDSGFTKGLPRRIGTNPVSVCSTGYLLNELLNMREYIPLRRTEGEPPARFSWDVDGDRDGIRHPYQIQREIEGYSEDGRLMNALFDKWRVGEPVPDGPKALSVSDILVKAVFGV